MKFTNSVFSIVLFSALGIFASSSAHAEVKVVTTVSDLAALTKAVGGSHVSVTSLSLPTQDPHYVDAKPSLALKLNRADMLVAVGMGLEMGWLPTLQVGARNSKVQTSGSGFVDCSVYVRKLGVPQVKIDRSMGDVHPQGNPHYLYDPRQALKCAKGIADHLASIDGSHSDDYLKNYTAFAAKMHAAEQGWQKTLANYRGAKIITYHESCEYLADWLGLEIIDTVEPKPGIAPSPGHVVQLVKEGRSQKIPYILQESYFSSKISKLLAGKIGASVVGFAGGTDVRAGQDYIARVNVLVKSLAAAHR